MIKVFLCESIHQDAYSKLDKHCQIISHQEDINDCDVIMTRNIKVDKDLINACSQLKLIVVHGTGFDDVDIQYAKEKGIVVKNTPGENAQSVAEMNVALMLELSRKIIPLYNDKKNKIIKDVAPINYLGHELFGKTFGMIGVGDIAKKTASILKNGFQMNIIGYSPSLTLEKANDLGIQYCSCMDDVFKQADYLSIGCSLNEETYHMITKDQLSLMKKTAYLINTSRGAIINEDDLYIALKNHWFQGAALDVLENEPIDYHPLLELDNVIYTSHMGASTDEALKRVGMKCVEIILDFFQ